MMDSSNRTSTPSSGVESAGAPMDQREDAVMRSLETNTEKVDDLKELQERLLYISGVPFDTKFEWVSKLDTFQKWYNTLRSNSEPEFEAFLKELFQELGRRHGAEPWMKKTPGRKILNSGNHPLRSVNDVVRKGSGMTGKDLKPDFTCFTFPPSTYSGPNNDEVVVKQYDVKSTPPTSSTDECTTEEEVKGDGLGNHREARNSSKRSKTSVKTPEFEALIGSSTYRFEHLLATIELKSNSKTAVEDRTIAGCQLRATNTFDSDPQRQFFLTLVLSPKTGTLLHFDRAGLLRYPVFHPINRPELLVYYLVAMANAAPAQLGSVIDTRTITVSGQSYNIGERRSSNMADRLVSRGTMVFKVTKVPKDVAMSASGTEARCMKISWVYDSYSDERKILQTLKAKKVEGVPVILDNSEGPCTCLLRRPSADNCHQKEKHRRQKILVMTDCGDTLATSTAEPRQMVEHLLNVQRILINALHLCDIYHTDVHPGNICVNQDGEVTLIDWDLARERNSSLLSPNPRTGVARYLACLLLEYDPTSRPIHSIWDDLESLLWIFVDNLIKGRRVALKADLKGQAGDSNIEKKTKRSLKDLEDLYPDLGDSKIPVYEDKSKIVNARSQFFTYITNYGFGDVARFCVHWLCLILDAVISGREPVDKDRLSQFAMSLESAKQNWLNNNLDSAAIGDRFSLLRALAEA